MVTQHEHNYYNVHYGPSNKKQCKNGMTEYYVLYEGETFLFYYNLFLTRHQYPQLHGRIQKAWKKCITKTAYA